MTIRAAVWIAAVLAVLGLAWGTVHAYNSALAEADGNGYARGKTETESAYKTRDNASLRAALAEMERLRLGKEKVERDGRREMDQLRFNWRRRRRMRKRMRNVCLLVSLMALYGCSLEATRPDPAPPTTLVAPAPQLPEPPGELMEREEPNFLGKLMRHFSSLKPLAPTSSPESSDERKN
jgi:hypothetical protein